MKIHSLHLTCAEAFNDDAASHLREKFLLFFGENKESPKNVFVMNFMPHLRLGFRNWQSWTTEIPAHVYSELKSAQGEKWGFSTQEAQDMIVKMGAQVADCAALPFQIGTVTAELRIPTDTKESPVEIAETFAAPLRHFLLQQGGMTKGQWNPRSPIVTSITVELLPGELHEVQDWISAAAQLRSGRMPSEAPACIKAMLPRHARSPSSIKQNDDLERLVFMGRAGYSFVIVEFVQSPPVTMPTPNDEWIIPFSLFAGIGDNKRPLLLLTLLNSWVQEQFTQLEGLDLDLRNVRDAIRDSTTDADHLEVAVTSLSPLGAKLSLVRTELGGVNRLFGGWLDAVADSSRQQEVCINLPEPWWGGSKTPLLGNFASGVRKGVSENLEKSIEIEEEVDRLSRHIAARLSLKSMQTMERLTKITTWMTVAVAAFTVVVFVRGLV